MSDTEVLAIRAPMKPIAEIANEYGVSVGLVGLIRGKAGYRVPGNVELSRRKELALAGIHRSRNLRSVS